LGIIFQAACADQVNADIRLAAALRFKNRLRNEDWNADKSPVQEDEKVMVKKAMVSAVIAAPSKVRNVLLEGLRRILEYDFPDRWPGLVEEVMQYLQGQDMHKITGALSVLRVLCKRFEYKPEGEDAPLDNVVNKCFPLLIQMFQYINGLPNIAPEIAFMQKLLCKIYWSATNMRIPPLFFSNAQHFAQWLDCFLQVLKQPVQETDALSPHWKVKKWIGHILNRLLSKYGNPRGLKKHEQQLGQAFIDAYAMKFLEGWMTLCSWYRAKQYVSPQPLALALNYMDTAMDFKPTYEIVRGNLDVLMFEVLFPMLCFTEADAEMWQDNPQEYIRKLYDPIGDLYNPRLSASNLLLKLSYPTKIFHAKDCLNRFLVFITNQLNKYQADAQKDFQAKDGCLFAIGSLRRRLRLNDEYKDHMEPLIQAHVIPEFQNPNGFLRAKACWVCSQYSKVDWKNPETLLAIVKGLLALMNDPELPVRVQAGTSLKDFVKIRKTKEVVQPLLEQMVGSLFKLMNEIDNDSIIETLEYIIEKFGENLANAALSLCRMLCEHFVKTSPNLPDPSAEDADDVPANLGDEEEESALAAAACLRALCTLIAAVHEHEELYPQMEQYFVPLFQLLMTQNKSEYLDEALELISRLTYFSKKISPQMWPVAFATMDQAYREWAPDYLPQMLAPLDNFISRDPETFCRGSHNGVRYIQMVYNMMETCLSDEDMENDFQVCPKLMDSILQNTKDYPAEVNEYVPRMFDLIMRTMQQHSGMGAGFKILCMNVIACGLFYNAQLTIQYLAERQILAPVFKMWFDMIPNMTRYYDKKLAVIGLTAILQAMNTHGTAWMPATFFNAEQMKLISGIIVKLVLECHADSKRMDEEDDDDDDEEEESDDDDDDLDDDDLDDDDDDDFVDAGGKDGFKFSAEDGGESLNKLIKEAREVNFGDKFNFNDDDDDLDEEDYECIIVELEESLIFRDVMAEMGSKHQELWNTVMGSLTPDTKQKLEAAVKYAEEKKEQKEAEEKAKQK
jgi:hypothetical protein